MWFIISLVINSCRLLTFVGSNSGLNRVEKREVVNA